MHESRGISQQSARDEVIASALIRSKIKDKVPDVKKHARSFYRSNVKACSSQVANNDKILHKPNSRDLTCEIVISDSDSNDGHSDVNHVQPSNKTEGNSLSSSNHKVIPNDTPSVFNNTLVQHAEKEKSSISHDFLLQNSNSRNEDLEINLCSDSETGLDSFYGAKGSTRVITDATESATETLKMGSPVIEIDSDSSDSIMGSRVPLQKFSKKSVAQKRTMPKWHFPSPQTTLSEQSSSRNSSYNFTKDQTTSPLKLSSSFQSAYLNYCSVGQAIVLPELQIPFPPSMSRHTRTHVTEFHQSFNTDDIIGCSSSMLGNISFGNIFSQGQASNFANNLNIGLQAVNSDSFCNEIQYLKLVESGGRSTVSENSRFLGKLSKNRVMTLLQNGIPDRSSVKKTTEKVSSRNEIFHSPVSSPATAGNRRETRRSAEKNRNVIAMVRKEIDKAKSNQTKLSRRKSDDIAPEAKKRKVLSLNKSTGSMKKLDMNETDKDKNEYKNDKNKTGNNVVNCSSDTENDGIQEKEMPADAERPMAKILMDLALQLVSSHVTKDQIKVTKRNLKSQTDDEGLLAEFQKRLCELKQQTKPFEMDMHECKCERFKSESINVLTMHQESGSSRALYRCCFCNVAFLTRRYFNPHMRKRHNFNNFIGKRLMKPKQYSCLFCEFSTDDNFKFSSHIKSCQPFFRPELNLHPHITDCDIFIKFNGKKGQWQRAVLSSQLMFEFESSNREEKSSLLVSAPPNLTRIVACDVCGEFFKNSFHLQFHKVNLHKMHLSKKSRKSHKTSSKGAKPCNKVSATKPSPNGTVSTNCRSPVIAKSQVFRNNKSPNSRSFRSEVDKGCNEIKCCFCGKYLGTDAVTHFQHLHRISMHTMVKGLYCYFCDNSFTQFASVEQHMITVHQSLFPDLESFWSQVFEAVNTCEIKARMTCSKDGAACESVEHWCCIKCGKHFSLAGFCYRHIVLEHMVTKIECQVCRKMVASGAAYTLHLQECHIKPCQVSVSCITNVKCNSLTKEANSASVPLIPIPIIPDDTSEAEMKSL